MIRIKGVIAAVVTAVLVVVFGIFLLNPLVKMGLIAALETVFKAKVEIASVNINVLKSKAVIKSLVIADRNKELKNLFEADEITADIQVTKLFLRKAIIDKVAVLNLAAGTDRKTSGFLPPLKLKEIEKKTGKAGFMEGLEAKVSDKAKAEIMKMPVVKLGDMAMKLKGKDLKQLVKKEDLESYKKVKEIETGIKAEKEKTSAAIAAVNIDPKIKSAKDSIDSVKAIKINGAQDIPAAKKGLEDLGRIKDSLDEAVKEVNTAKASAESFASYSGGALKEIEKAKEADINNVMKNMDINLVDAGNLEKMLIGPVWYDRVQKAMEITAIAKKWLPPAKKKGKGLIMEKKRGKGRDIIFIGELPDLWIKNIEISTKGSTDKYMFKGFIKNFTTEQAAIGKPLTFEISADKGGMVFGAAGKIDHITAINDFYTLYGKNLPPEMTGLNDTDYGSVKMKKADMDTEAKVTSTDESLSLKGTAGLKKMSFDAADKQDITYQVLSGIDALKISFEVKNTAAGPGINVSSDVFDRIKRSLEKIYGKKINEAKEMAKKEIDSRVKDEISKLTGKISGDNSEIGGMIKTQEGKLKGANSEVDKVSAGINKKIADSAMGGAGNALKGLFK
jgi:uncharacterized protein (TIGR03545 family)